MKPVDRFSGRAGAYRAGRPSYPDAVLEALFAGLGDPQDVVAVDLGAGTGISSRLLAAFGARVYAVEPNAPMRAAAEPDARVTFVDATAEATGLVSAGADLVTAFQAFHWFDSPAALAEMRRLLRAGGRAAVIYNERDESDPVTRAYGDIVRRYATSDVENQRARAPLDFAAFGGWRETRSLVFSNTQAMDRAKVIARAASTSYLPSAGPAAAALHDALGSFIALHSIDGCVTMRLQTHVTIGEV
ncbi:MAG: class I SAM-dependent methyltransferase [Candidatus Velthaea sp.]